MRNLPQKYARLKQGDRNAFIDPGGYAAFVAEKEHEFKADLQEQSEKQSAAQKGN